MFSFFAALICIVGIMVVKTHNKRSSQRVAQEYNTERETMASFFEKYAASPCEENMVREKIVNRDPEIDDLIAELREVSGIKPTHPMIVYAYFAKQGRVPSELSLRQVGMSDSPLVCAHDNIWRRIVGVSDVAQMRDARLRFLKWYDLELRENGVTQSLLCAPAGARGDVNFSLSTAATECENAAGMVFYWRPIVGCLLGVVN